ncbi:MAG: polyhydroxyalkanoate synthesis regulator DNA-binding domain-containing protein [Steroidobacteraceae bacterium]
MSDTRIIKKYPNRRLYDTTESRYITLEDVRRLAVARLPFRVLEQRTQQDITRMVLLQVIAEQEQAGAGLLSESLLLQLVCCYGTPDANTVSAQLEQGLRRLPSNPP